MCSLEEANGSSAEAERTVSQATQPPQGTYWHKKKKQQPSLSSAMMSLCKLGSGYVLILSPVSVSLSS